MKLNLEKRRGKVLLAVVSILVILGASKGLYHWISTKSEMQGEQAMAVQTVQAKTLAMSMTVDTVGSLYSVREAKLKAAAPGKVQKFLMESGSFVKKGSQLAEVVGGPELRAPFDGYLTDWKVKEGEFISASTELVDLVDTTLLSLHYRLPEHYAAQLAIGQTVNLAVKALPNRVFKGAVTYISPVIDKKTHTILVHARVDNPEQDLWPGMFARVSHLLQEEAEVIVIPESSLMLTLEGYEVLVVREGKLVRCPVQVGARNRGRAQILAGVKRDESVLLTRNRATREGSLVTAHDWSGDW